MTFWRPFCLCKLGGQDLKILLGNRIFWIQHTQIRLNSLVPNFYSQMLLTFTFPRNPTRLLYTRPRVEGFECIILNLLFKKNQEFKLSLGHQAMQNCHPISRTVGLFLFCFRFQTFSFVKFHETFNRTGCMPISESKMSSPHDIFLTDLLKFCNTNKIL